MVRADMQIALLQERLQSLNEKRNELVGERDLAEAEYRAEPAKGDLTESEMKETIEKACESAHKTHLFRVAQEKVWEIDNASNGIKIQHTATEQARLHSSPKARANVHIALLEEKLKSVDEKRDEKLKDPHLAEAEWRAQAAGGDPTVSQTNVTSKEADASAQKLHLFHVAHEKVLENDETVEDAKQRMVTLRAKVRKCDMHMASLKEDLQKELDKVDEHVFIPTQPRTLFNPKP